MRELRPDLRHVEAAVAGKPSKHHIAETQHGGLPPRRNIARQTTLQRRRPHAQAFDINHAFFFDKHEAIATIKRFGAEGKWHGVKREGDLSKGKAAIRPNTRSSRYRGL